MIKNNIILQGEVGSGYAGNFMTSNPPMDIFLFSVSNKTVLSKLVTLLELLSYFVSHICYVGEIFSCSDDHVIPLQVYQDL
jgi:hypothetical protein